MPAQVREHESRLWPRILLRLATLPRTSLTFVNESALFQFVLVTVTILNETDRCSTLLTGYWVIKAMIYGSQLIESGGQPMSLNVVLFLVLLCLLTRMFPWTSWIIPIQ